MPELPEVETVRRGLEPSMIGRRIERVKVITRQLRFPIPAKFEEELEQQTILDVMRKAKYLLFPLSSQKTLIAHLGMTGSFRIRNNNKREKTPSHYYYDKPSNQKHDHLELTLDNGRIVIFNDPRRFGLIDLASTPQLIEHRLFAHLGYEPFDPALDVTTLEKNSTAKRRA